jgi:hypothetical protein
VDITVSFNPFKVSLNININKLSRDLRKAMLLKFPPDSAEDWQTFALVVTVIFLILAFGFGLANAIIGWRVNLAKKEESRRKDDQLTLNLKAKDVLIEEARASASSADERAEKANERAQKIEGENLILRTDLNKATEEVAGLQKDAANARAAQQTVEIELSKQKERTAIAERLLLELQERVKPRHITPAQAQAMISALRNAPKTKISFYSVDAESSALVRQLSSVLEQAGWNEIGGGDGKEVYAFSPPFTGIKITQKTVTLSLKAISEAFRTAGLSITPGYNETMMEGLIEIQIGSKP